MDLIFLTDSANRAPNCIPKSTIGVAMKSYKNA